MIPVRETAPKFQRDVRQILVGSEVGVRQENIAPFVTFEWLTARAPVTVAVDLREEPIITWSTAEDTTTRTNGTDRNPRIRATWVGGAFRIDAIDVTTAASVYIVKIGLMRG